MSKGLHDRFETPCYPNNWKTYRANGELPPPTDPRWVSLVVADASKFEGQGQGVIPIRIFAGFYVTGYDHDAKASGCPEDDPHPPPVPSKNKGDVWGYFVTNVILDNDSDSNEFCDFTDIGLCFARLTQ
jgi:hypothetical protein